LLAVEPFELSSVVKVPLGYENIFRTFGKGVNERFRVRSDDQLGAFGSFHQSFGDDLNSFRM